MGSSMCLSYAPWSPAQERVFEAQVRLAVELRKPLFMHCRDAGARFADILRCATAVQSGTAKACEVVRELGCSTAWCPF